MQKKETRTRTYEEVVDTICDICKGSIKQDEDEIVQIKHFRYSNDIPDVAFEPDICSKCFKEKIIPGLSFLGCPIKYEIL